MSKRKIVSIIVLLLCLGTVQLTADTIIDSVYSTPELDGSISFSQNNQSCSVCTWSFQMGAGDVGMVGIWPDPNSRKRAYVSFELPQIPDGYEIDSVYIRLYQNHCAGNEYPGFPIWDVPGGDTMFCIMDHIDYGNELDVSDWTKGDSGDSGTIHTNIGVISDSAEYGYRYFDITPYVIDDYTNGRDKTQYRIRFPIETDWDYLVDWLYFLARSADPETAPLIVIYFTSYNSIEDEIFPEAPSVSFYPNPFAHSLTISFSTPYGYLENIKIEIYNVKGRLIMKLDISTENETQWDGRDRYGNVVCNGLYLIRIESKDVNVIKKVLKLN